MEMFDTLVDFLKSHAPPQIPVPEAKKFFSSVSTTESARLFEFLISRILPDFKITRLETDVPEALTLLEYPYIRSVTKSSLISVTTRQAVAGLLVIFCWLIKEIESETIESLGGDSDDSIDVQREIYRAIIEQPETAPDAVKHLIAKVDPPEDKQSLAMEVEASRAEAEVLRRELQEINDLEAEHQALVEDLLKSREYVEKMKLYAETKRQEKEEGRERLMKLEYQIQETKARLSNLSVEIRNHGLSIDEVMRDLNVESDLKSRESKMRQQINDFSVTLEKDKDTIRLFNDQANEGKEKLLTKLRTYLVLHEESRKNLLSMLEQLEMNNFSCRLDLSQLQERIEEIRKFVAKLEQSDIRYLDQSNRLIHELELFIQKMRATNSNLESELTNGLTDIELRISEAETKNDKVSQEVIPRLREAIKREEKTIDQFQAQNADSLARVNSQIEDESIKYLQAKENLDRLTSRLKDEIEIAQNRLNNIKKDGSNALSQEKIKSLMTLISQKQKRLILDAQRDEAQWQDILGILSDNHRVCKASIKKIMKKLGGNTNISVTAKTD